MSEQPDVALQDSPSVQPEVMQSRDPFRRAIETQLLIDRFRIVAYGEAVAYSELEAIAGPNWRNYFETARKALLEEKIVLRSKAGESYYRLTPEQVAHAWEGRKTQIQNAAGRGIRESAAIPTDDYAKLSDDAKRVHRTGQLFLTIARSATRKDSLKKLEAQQTQNQKQLSVAQGLRALLEPKASQGGEG
jgi:hypothetical protein